MMVGERRVWWLVLLLLLTGSALAAAADLVEFLSGARAEGTVKAIRKDEKEFDFELKLGGRTVLRTYPFSKVRAVTMRGKRYVLNQQPGSAPAAGGGTRTLRTRAEVRRVIEQAGATPPAWFASTPLDFPKTLDLSWPEKPPEKGWNNQANVGQYIWDIINPNTNRWRSGVRLVHHIMARHEKDRDLLRRDMKSLGAMYFRLFQDYARAAFWLQKAGVGKGDPQSAMLAECYWRLGNKQMAMEMLSARRLPLAAIKVFGDMGETRKAIQLAGAFARGPQPHEALLLGGDACRQAGQYNQAIRFYERVLSAPKARNEQYEQRYTARAEESIDAIRLFDQADVQRVQDGKYRGSATGYNAAIVVEVHVAEGRIDQVDIVEHREKQFYSALTDTPSQILKKQTVKGIDGTSRATITSQAIVNAAARALAGKE